MVTGSVSGAGRWPGLWLSSVPGARPGPVHAPHWPLLAHHVSGPQPQPSVVHPGRIGRAHGLLGAGAESRLRRGEQPGVQDGLPTWGAVQGGSGTQWGELREGTWAGGGSLGRPPRAWCWAAPAWTTVLALAAPGRGSPGSPSGPATLSSGGRARWGRSEPPPGEICKPPPLAPRRAVLPKSSLREFSAEKGLPAKAASES